MWKPVSKSSCKVIFEKFIVRESKLTQTQLRTILDLLCTKKDGTTSPYTVKTMLPLYEALDRGEFPSLPAMLTVLRALNKPFVRRKKKVEDTPEAEEQVFEDGVTAEEEEMLNAVVNAETLAQPEGSLKAG
jgi:hypothetical protein